MELLDIVTALVCVEHLARTNRFYVVSLMFPVLSFFETFKSTFQAHSTINKPLVLRLLRSKTFFNRRHSKVVGCVIQMSILYSILHFAAQAHPVGGQVVASQAVAMDPGVERAEHELEDVKAVREEAKAALAEAKAELKEAQKKQFDYLVSTPAESRV